MISKAYISEYSKTGTFYFKSEWNIHFWDFWICWTHNLCPGEWDVLVCDLDLVLRKSPKNIYRTHRNNTLKCIQMTQIFNKISSNTHWIGFDSKWNLSVKFHYNENRHLWNIIKKQHLKKILKNPKYPFKCAYFITWGLVVFLVNELQYR